MLLKSEERKIHAEGVDRERDREREREHTESTYTSYPTPLFWYTIHISNCTHDADLPAAKKCLSYGYPKNITRKTYPHINSSLFFNFNLKNRNNEEKHQVEPMSIFPLHHISKKPPPAISRSPFVAFRMEALAASPFHPSAVVVQVDHIRHP